MFMCVREAASGRVRDRGGVGDCVHVCERDTHGRKSRQEEKGDIKRGKKRGEEGKRQDKGTQIKREDG